MDLGLETALQKGPISRVSTKTAGPTETTPKPGRLPKDVYSPTWHPLAEGSSIYK